MMRVRHDPRVTFHPVLFAQLKTNTYMHAYIDTYRHKSKWGFQDRWDRIINVCSMKRPVKGLANCFQHI